MKKNPAEEISPESGLHFGSALRDARVRKKLSQDALAGMLGVTRFTVINWESDKNKPDVDMLLRLCRTLDLSAVSLFPEDLLLSPLEVSIMETIRSLRPETRKLVGTVTRAIAEQEMAIRTDLLREVFRVVPLEPGSLSAGLAGKGSRFPDDAASPFFLRVSDRTAKADAVIRVSGDSMKPVYHDGDLVYFCYAESADPGEDVVIAWAGEQYVKRLDDHGRLFSVNPQFPFRYDGNGDDIRILGRVLGIVSSADLADESDFPLLEDLFRDELAAFSGRTD